MPKELILVADVSKPLVRHECSRCHNPSVADTSITACPYCGEGFDDKPTNLKTNVTASLSGKSCIKVTCSQCNHTTEVYNSDHNAYEFSLTRFCPCCGASELDETPTSDDDASTPPATDKKPTTTPAANDNQDDSSSDDSGFNSETCTGADCEEVSASDDSTPDESKQDAITETQEDVQETLDDSDDGSEDDPEAIDVDTLQWRTFDDEKGKDNTLVAFNASAIPLFRFQKDKCTQGIQDIFGTKLMITAFNQIANEKGIGQAVSQFNGCPCNNPQILNSDYVDSLVQNKLMTTLLPKLIECFALATDGALKGVYPDVRNDIYDSFANSLMGYGLPREVIDEAISTNLGAGGNTVFASLLSKAVELMAKTPEAYDEAKSMISAAVSPKPQIDPERQKVIATLNGQGSNGIVIGNSPVDFGNNQTTRVEDINKLRERLKFSNRH